MSAPRILKFGGTSVATAERLRAVAAIAARARAKEPVVVVVSALGGVTNGLLAAAHQAAGRETIWQAALAALIERHRAVAAELVSEAAQVTGVDVVEEQLAENVAASERELGELLHGAFLLREVTPRALDQIASHGERLAAPLAAAAMSLAGTPATAVDARELLVTDRTFGNARVDQAASELRLRRWWQERERPGQPLPVVTGFLAATADGETTTLGRGGSDLTAALFGAALDAPVIEIWTDVSGVLSADPRLVTDAFPLPQLSYEELMELSHFGAKVVYPPTVHPAKLRGIPLLIKNTFAPDDPGTWVGTGAAALAPSSPSGVRGLASISRVALLRLEGDGMIGVPGIAGRLFGALARRSISVILITQASSEHSICFALRPDEVAAAEHAVAEEFRLEVQVGLVDPLVAEHDLAILAVVGDGMRERPGVAGQLFGELGRHRVNVRAIAQGSSELNISCVIAAVDEARALAALHRALFAPDLPRANADEALSRAVSSGEVEIYLAGVGGVGGELLRQLAARRGDGLRVAGAAGRDRMVVPATSPAPSVSDPANAGLGTLVAAAVASGGRRIFVDCTASAATTAVLPRLLAAGVAVVAANKVPFTAPWDVAGPLFAAAERGWVRHATTVGAGLPFLRTVRERRLAGDPVRRLEGVFSGTVSFLLERLGRGVAFSEAVREAFDLGYTEPDPRDDLGGVDVARKLLILARAAGVPLELAEVEVVPLLAAEPWNALTLTELWQRLPEVDADFAARGRRAEAAGRRLAYLAILELDPDGGVDAGGAAGARARARVELVEVALDHPAAKLSPGENLCVFTTALYRDLPLVVRGPGAGREITAAGVLADICGVRDAASYPHPVDSNEIHS